MGKAKTIPKPKPKKLPYFRSGTLVFADSGHVLGISDRHYRCALSSHRKCNANGERQINKETLERSFGRLAGKFEVDKKVCLAISDEILKKTMWELVVGLEEQSDSQEEIMTATTEVMWQEGVVNKKVEPSDIEDFERAFIKSQEVDYPIMLCGFIINFLKMASHPENEAMLGRNLAILTKQIKLTKEGKILEIELEPWGWYTVNYIEKYSAGYLKGIKDKGVKILNTPNEFLKLPIHEAALKYGVGYTHEAMGQDMTVIYGMFRYVKDMMRISLNLNPEQMAVALPYMFKRLQNDPAIRIISQAMGAFGIIPEMLPNPKNKEP